MVMSSGAIVGLRDNNNAYYYFWKQLFFTAIGLILLGVASSVPVNGYWKVANLAFVVSFITEFIPFIPGIGKSVNGNTAWINLGFFTIQPSEFMKLFMIIFIAKLMAENEGRETARVPFSTIEVLPMWLYFAVAILAIIPVIGGKDMGTAMVMLFIVLLLGYLQNLPSFEFRMPLVVTVLGIAGGLLLGTNRIARIQAWLFPDSPAGAIYSWQSQHGLWALAGGGLFGAGLGNSKLKWSWIPEVQNDYIFAVIGEELGMLGALLTIGLFVLLSVHLFRIYQRCDTLFARSITMGVALWITLQAFINIAVVLTMLPVLGVPLPLVSYGGSSVISGIVAIGVVLSFERDNHKRLGPRR
jgi:cell division protein FtsW (lipid II flippase)